MMFKPCPFYPCGDAGKAVPGRCPDVCVPIVRRVPDPVRLWLIDDTLEHHATARATLAAFPGVDFTGFEDAGEAIDEYRRLVEAGGRDLPRIVLMDFYLGVWRGDAVTRELMRLAPPAAPLLVVGYSSVPAGSERILAAGGDIVVRKTRDKGGRNPFLARWLEDFLRA
jgi:hypothetical protein